VLTEFFSTESPSRYDVITISAVIPTYNRRESLLRTLRSLALQTELPEEVIIVDASDDVRIGIELTDRFPSLNVKYIRSLPSLCAQRNTGIRSAVSSHVFLCDDDLEFPIDYILKLKTFIRNNSDVHVITGCWNERNKVGQWGYEYPVKSISQLCWKFIFQQSVWCDIKNMKTGSLNRLIFHFVSHFYLKRKNNYTLAGWPLVTDFEKPVFKTAFYSLGASIIRRDWLLSSPFDEVLDANGIGDHYGVALHFPDFPAISVLTDVPVHHHKIKDNRLSEAESFYRRGLALHFFMSKSEIFTLSNRLFFIWSLTGNWFAFLAKGNWLLLQAATKLISAILKGSNPYILKSGNKKLRGI
jgi:glycosyltransferase involved in cell wall biosynthesis